MTTEEVCIRSLREAADRLDESPTKAQYEELGLRPASATIIRVMGGWNAAKQAAGLNVDDRAEFGGNPIEPRPPGVDIPDGVAWEELNPQQRWYYKNRERRIAVKNRRKDELRRWFHDLKRDECECERCGEGHPSCIDFHHVEEKERGVAQMVNFGHSKRSIRAEIDRCVPLCANCHRKEHYQIPTEVKESPEEGDEGRTEEERLS